MHDFWLSLCSTALGKYFAMKKDESSDVTVAIPFTFKQIPNKVSNFKFDNNSILLPFYMPLETDFRSACYSVKSKMKFLRNSLLPTGFYVFH